MAEALELVIRPFQALTLEELREIYRARQAVFIVEQECPYQDIDDFDPVAIHVFYRDGGGIQAYLRVLPEGTVHEKCSLGRVISLRRRCGLASALVAEGIRVAREAFHAREIDLSAQVYARGLYEKAGFVQTSGEYLEDGIPHIHMRWSAPEA